MNGEPNINPTSQPVKSANKLLFVPLGVFCILVTILAIGFKLDNPHLLPSALLKRPFPAFELMALNAPKRTLTEQDLKGKVALINVWATWCANCVLEHPELMHISQREGIPIYGINYKDDTIKAQRWLRQHGDPYAFTLVDAEGKLGIDLGIYGAPETFIIDASGVIQYKHIGVITPALWRQTLAPLIKQLQSYD